MVRLAVFVLGTGSPWHLAGNIGIAVEALGTGALLAMIDGQAESVGAAGSGIGTWIDALLSHAGEVLGTALVVAAAGHAVQAQAQLPMAAFVVVPAERLAHTLLAAFVGQTARIVGAQGSAHRLKAGQSIGTVTILAALQRRRSHTAHLGRRVGHHALQAATARPVVGHRAGGIRTAGALQTGIHTLVVAAGLGGTAILVGVAAIDALVVQADMSQEAIVVHTTGHYRNK